MPNETPKSVKFPFLLVSQPLGDFYIASIPAKELVNITYFDVRRVMMEERDVEKYLGIQRKLNAARVKQIVTYINTVDAVFPTAVIIAVKGKCVEINQNIMTLSNYLDGEESDHIYYRNIARVLDGQHRLAGLEEYQGNSFDVNVSIFVDADISDQANIFSTVNLAQTKVNKSLAYDLYELMKTRSPQKMCHNVAVTLDKESGSPFHKKIKRLGIATDGRSGETITQAAFIEPLLKYVSVNPQIDRDLYLRQKRPEKIAEELLSKHLFQHMFVDNKDFEITDIVWNYFEAIKRRWPRSWESRERSQILNRTNGYRAFMRLLSPIYLDNWEYGHVPSVDQFLNVLNRIHVEDNAFSTDNYGLGAGGENSLFRDLETYLT